MKKKVFDKEKNKGILLFIAFAFILGFLLGWVSNASTLSDIEIELENLHLDLRSFNEFLAFAEIFDLDTCDTVFIDYLGSRIYDSGVVLEGMEEEGQVDNPEYELLKQRHNINQVIYYSELKKFKDSCGHDRNVVLFFFDGEEPEEASSQGRIIGEVAKEKRIILLPMDYGYTHHISYFYDYYDIGELPSLIINYDTKFEGITNKETLLSNLN